MRYEGDKFHAQHFISLAASSFLHTIYLSVPLWKPLPDIYDTQRLLGCTCVLV